MWTTHLYGFGSSAKPHLQLDRPLLSKQHQIMGRLCADARTLVDVATLNFDQTALISSFTLSRADFVARASVIMRDYIYTVPLTFIRLTKLTTELLAANLFASAFNTDWLIEFGNASNDNLVRNVPRYYANGTCNCAVSDECQEPMRIGPPEKAFPGLVVGCMPIHGLRMSTLECLYSSTCVNDILSYLEYYTAVDGSAPTDFIKPNDTVIKVAPLDRSIPSRYAPSTPIGTLIDEFFIEHWDNRSMYENYFQQCAPSACQYEYIERKGLLFVATALLGIYGGLTIALRFIVWNMMRTYVKVQHQRDMRLVTVQPRSVESSV